MDIFVEFTKPKKRFPILSWVIKAFQRTDYSHVRLRWFSKTGEEIIYEASGSRVKVIGSLAQKDFPIEVAHCFKIEVSHEEYRNLIRLFRYSSVSYGILQLFGIAFALLFGLKRNILAQKNTQVCSELLGLFAKEVKGWDLGLDLDLAGPREIYEKFYALSQTEEDIRNCF